MQGALVVYDRFLRRSGWWIMATGGINSLGGTVLLPRNRIMGSLCCSSLRVACIVKDNDLVGASGKTEAVDYISI